MAKTQSCQLVPTSSRYAETQKYIPELENSFENQK